MESGKSLIRVERRIGLKGRNPRTNGPSPVPGHLPGAPLAPHAGRPRGPLHQVVAAIAVVPDLTVVADLREEGIYIC